MSVPEDAPKKRKVKVPGYHVESVLGRGAQGVVVKAKRERDGRIVAVKILSPQMAKVSEYRQRFRREAAMAMEIAHPNIVGGLEVGLAEGLPFVVMEFVEGETLADRLRRGTLPDAEVRKIARDVAQALACAHGRQLVHRDIKPENLMLALDGTTKLMDLGLAKEIGGGGEELTMTGSVFGTPGYISPEGAVDSKDTDIRSDLYSLGATLYRAVVGEVPFPGKTLTLSLRRALTEPVVPPIERIPSCDPNLSTLIVKLLARDRRDRPQDPAALLEDLNRIERGEPPVSPPPLRTRTARNPTAGGGFAAWLRRLLRLG